MASNYYVLLREKVLGFVQGGATPPDSIVKECTTFFQGIILDCLNSGNSHFQSYCAYADFIGIDYISDVTKPSPMWVIIRENKAVICVNVCVAITIFKEEQELLFGIAHEVKHLLYQHLIKYKPLMREDVTALFVNLATDVEINESLKSELVYGREGKYIPHTAHISIPSNSWDYMSMSRLLQVDLDTVVQLAYNVQNGKECLSDVFYQRLNGMCKTLLGFSIGEIIYECKIRSVSFVEQIFNVVDGMPSIFIISDTVGAVSFCRELAKYLTRQVRIYLNASGQDVNSMFKDLGNSCDGLGVENIDSLGDDVVSEAISEAKEIGDKIVETVNKGNGSIGRGTGRGGQSEIKFDRKKTKVPWQSILDRRLRVLTEKYQLTKRRLNRRQPHRLELSGKRREPEINLVIAFDESSSVSNAEFMYSMSEVESIISNYNCSLHLYEFTYQVENYTYLPNKETKNFISKFSTSRYEGGTAFSPVFDAIRSNKRINNWESLVIFFTDGEAERNVDMTGVSNRMWVLFGNGGDRAVNLSCEEEERNIYRLVDAVE